MLRARTLASTAVCATVFVLACEPDPDTGAPCEDDLNNCSENTDEFEEDPECELEGDLDITIGQGELEFSPLAEGQMPDPEWGLQGGQHLWMAVQVHNPDLERLQLRIKIEVSFCDSADCTPASAWQADNIRELVADETTMTITPEGWIEQTRMLVTVFGWVQSANQRVEMTVTDPCGRQAYVVRESLAD